jgi:hypothetical protein
MKRQGTNDVRELEGKGKQAKDNAIERLGKNLIGIRATLQYEKVTPFVCFGWGVDFAEGSSIRDRIITMNEFYPLNRIFIHKREGYSPVSMFFQRTGMGVVQEENNMGYPGSRAGVKRSFTRCCMSWRPRGSGCTGYQRSSRSLHTCSASPMAIAGVRGRPCWCKR